MGNCQAIDTATLVIQHPNGKVERMYSSVSASQVMKANPGHHVAILISSTSCASQHHRHPHHHLRLTRIKLLKPSDSLLLGHVYRLITSQEVMRGLWAKKQAKMKKILSESERQSFQINTIPRINAMENNQERTRETEGGRRRRTSNGGRGRTWEPSLQSISEASS
ncbi:uncharacterized protein LOC129310015 [Prosopis cineraria]|uniref:uncharacterized protein LOC129310015 n=1 Tax=Prosopis cineraria TaxID=364024 RepID=UPI00241052B1|nr:uncharacterized protein LOC129310015 [Prosopis cineraria]